MPKKETEFPEIVALRLDTATRKKLEAMAKTELRSIGAMGRIVLMEGITAREKKVAKKKKPAKYLHRRGNLPGRQGRRGR